ncbi:MAG: RidA family protein [Candidatus Limnocylindrales bacterium]
MQLTHHNPSGLPHGPAFSQAVSVTGAARTIYVGGQNAVSADGSIVGEAVGEQTAQTLANLETVLADAGARMEDVVMWSISLVDQASLPEAFGAFQQFWGRRSHPPAITVAIVAALANPRFRVEISAIAVAEA